MTILQAKFEITGWDEHPFDEGDGTAKLTEATVSKSYTGDVEGSSTTKWLMAYAPDGTATFVGIERITGAVGGRTGTLVLQHIGQFADGAAKRSSLWFPVRPSSPRSRGVAISWPTRPVPSRSTCRAPDREDRLPVPVHQVVVVGEDDGGRPVP